MNFDEWVQTLPAEIKQDALWKVEAYRLSHVPVRNLLA